MKIRCNNKRFTELKFNNIKKSSYGKKGIIINYNYHPDPKLGVDIVGIRKIPCSCDAFTTILSLSWD